MSHSQCYSAQCTPTVYPAEPFNAKEDAAILLSAMKTSFYIDEQVLVEVFAHRKLTQRLEIVKEFATMYARDMVSEIRMDFVVEKEFKKAIVGLMTSLPEYYAEELNNAISDFTADEDALIEILSSLTNSEIKTISTVYKNVYQNEPAKDIRGYISGHFQDFLASLSYANRDENPEVDEATATRDAEALFGVGERPWETDESTFNAILITRSFPQLRKIFQEYERIAGHSIEDTITRKFSGPLEDGYLAVVKCARDKTAFFAERLHKAISGWGTKYSTLNHIIIGRSEIDLGDIKVKYQSMYGKSLADDIYEETSDNYRKLLLALLG